MYLGIPFMWDPDWVWDLIPIPGDMHVVFDNATHPRCNRENIGLLHCEIDSAIKDAGCIGGIIGAIAGAALALAVLVPLLAVSCGPLAFICVILAFLIAAAVTYAGAWLGGMIGAHVFGNIIDALSGNGDEFESLEDNTCIGVIGRWVIDRDHGWNEIHPVAFFTPPARDELGNPIRDACPSLCPLPIIE